MSKIALKYRRLPLKITCFTAKRIKFEDCIFFPPLQGLRRPASGKHPRLRTGALLIYKKATRMPKRKAPTTISRWMRVTPMSQRKK